jgi:hypothetical protein
VSCEQLRLRSAAVNRPIDPPGAGKQEVSFPNENNLTP